MMSTDNKVPPEMLENFIVFGEECHSELFDSQWKRLSADIKDADITFNCIYERIWKPTISNCLSFLNKVYTKSLSLSDVKKLSIQNLARDLQHLCCAMYKCYQSELSFCEPFNWVKDVVKHIGVYQKIVTNTSSHLSALKFCLRMKELLQLQEDFPDINDLLKCVST